MRWLLAILSLLVFFCAFVLAQAAMGPLHGIYGLLAALIATALLVGAAIIDAIVRMGGRHRVSYTNEEDEQIERIRRI